MISKRTASWQGMNWITQLRRMQIYIRDGFICQSCGYDFLNQSGDGRRMELDHIVTHNAGGTNESTNLYTCCGGTSGCNNTRQDKTMAEFFGEERAARIIAQAQKPIGDRTTALQLITERKAQKANRK